MEDDSEPRPAFKAHFLFIIAPLRKAEKKDGLYGCLKQSINVIELIHMHIYFFILNVTTL